MSSMPESGYSKLVLFGGSNAEQSVVEIDTNGYAAKKIGDFQIQKFNHSSEKIGKDVFILGDLESKKIEKYDLETNQSEIISLEMTSLKGDYSSVVCSNKVYVIGGYLKDVASSLYTVEYFEPEKMTWIEAPELLKDVRFHDSVNVDETIYTIGGYRSSKFQRFDPREGVWSYLMYIPNQTYHSAVTSFGQTITCVGGGDRGSHGLCQVYDIRNDTWSKIENIPITVYGAKSLENERSIVVAGGCSDTLQAYDKERKTWDILGNTLPTSNKHSSKIVM